MQVQGSRGAAVYVGVPVCLGLAPAFKPQEEVSWPGFCSGSNLGLELEKKKKMAGVYCSCGCLEVTGRKHARFVKNEQRARGIKQTTSSYKGDDWDHTYCTERITQTQYPCLRFRDGYEFPYIYPESIKNPIRVDLELILLYKLMSPFECA